jgi:membrane dipeptidase
MLNDLAESGDDFVLTTSVTQIRSVVASGKIAFVACAQGATPLEDQPEILSLFHRLGLKVLQLVTNRGNPYAGSARMSPKLGLSELGRTIVAEAQRLRIVIDVSAVSKPGFWELMEMIDGPVMASQSNASALCNFADNFDDDQIRAVAEKVGS